MEEFNIVSYLEGLVFRSRCSFSKVNLSRCLIASEDKDLSELNDKGSSKKEVSVIEGSEALKEVIGWERCNI